MPTRYFETTLIADVLKMQVDEVRGSGPAESLLPGKNETGATRRTILVVDDEHVIADSLVAILNQSGFSASAAYDAESAIDLISARVPDLLISDVCMPGMNGVELAIQVCERFPGCKVLLFSGHAGSTPLLEEARKKGYDFDFLSKPVHPRDLLARLNWVGDCPEAA